MPQNEQEVEVKFMLRDLPALRERVVQLGADVTAERVLETNLRFDRPDQSLRRAGQALRLRQDAAARMTFKGPPITEGGASSRQEIEFEVSDYGAGRRFIEALGFAVTFIYEKYRTTYRLGEVNVTLDEMPYGSFAEIEYAGAGDAVAAIHAAADQLGLNWEARSTASYMGLFDLLKSRGATQASNLTFEAFKDSQVTPEDLNMQYAD